MFTRSGVATLGGAAAIVVVGCLGVTNPQERPASDNWTPAVRDAFEFGVPRPDAANVPMDEVNRAAAAQHAKTGPAVDVANGWGLYNSVVHFSQCDGRWGSHKLGHSQYSLCSAGCVVSSLAMAYHRWGHALDPGQVNSWGKSAGAFSGPYVVWSKIADYGTDRHVRWLAHHEIYEYVRRGWPVLMETDIYGGHWMLVKAFSRNGDGKFYVNDPIRGADVAAAGTFRRACIFVWP